MMRCISAAVFAETPALAGWNRLMDAALRLTVGWSTTGARVWSLPERIGMRRKRGFGFRSFDAVQDQVQPPALDLWMVLGNEPMASVAKVEDVGQHRQFSGVWPRRNQNRSAPCWPGLLVAGSTRSTCQYDCSDSRRWRSRWCGCAQSYRSVRRHHRDPHHWGCARFVTSCFAARGLGNTVKSNEV